jgi:predicted phage terminase large subunit-like protein
MECPFPAAVLAERARQMGPTAAARGLGNRPVSAAMCPFQEEHFEGPEPLPPRAYPRRILFADPAGDATRLKTGDPDYCGVVAIGYHPEDRCWEVFLADRMRGSPFAQAEFIARKALQARVSVVYQEAVRDEALVEVTQRTLRELGATIAVRPVKPTTNKEIRVIQTLEPALAARPPLLRVCGKTFPELKNEALAFPVAGHDDLLDAAAGAFAKIGTGSSLLTGAVEDDEAFEEDDGDHPLRDCHRKRRMFEGITPSGGGLDLW